jgi:2Fe-2S iron-sulfur cluster binding domain
VLNALNAIKWEQDGTLMYRRSCAHGVCGSDAMRINGRNRLACKVLMHDLGQRVTIEPLIGFRVIKDFVVDMEPFFASYRSIEPHLIAAEARSEGERLLSPEERVARRNASSAPPARSPGRTSTTSARRPSSTPTGSSSTAAMGGGRASLHLGSRQGRLALPDNLQPDRGLPKGIKVTRTGARSSAPPSSARWNDSSADTRRLLDGYWRRTGSDWRPLLG